MCSLVYKTSKQLKNDYTKIIDDLIADDKDDDKKDDKKHELSQKTSAHKVILLFKFIGMIRDSIKDDDFERLNTYVSKAVKDWKNVQPFIRLLTLVV